MTRSLSFFVIIAALPAYCQRPAYNPTAVVRYAKDLDVATLDPNLPRQRLEDWLKLGPPNVDEVQWQVNNCDLKSNRDEPEEKQPLCVRFGFRRDHVGGWGIVTVGTALKGVDGHARFEYAQVASSPPNPRGRTTNKLSEIAVLLDEMGKPKN